MFIFLFIYRNDIGKLSGDLRCVVESSKSSQFSFERKSVKFPNRPVHMTGEVRFCVSKTHNIDKNLCYVDTLR